MKFDKTLIPKIKYQIKEGKWPVAYWAVERLIEYIEYLENNIDKRITRLEEAVKNK